MPFSYGQQCNHFGFESQRPPDNQYFFFDKVLQGSKLEAVILVVHSLTNYKKCLLYFSLEGEANE
jgi:hypothetical protein